VTWRTGNLAAPTLARPLFSINVEGRIADIQRCPKVSAWCWKAVRLKGSNVPPPEMMPARCG
jgi:competence protein ComEC